MHGNIQNIDYKERDKFDLLAGDWWDPNGKLRTLHHINPVRLQYIEKSVQLQDKKILDLGCGGGLLAEAMAKKNALVTGLDISKSAIEIANAHKNQSGLQIDYVVNSAEQYAVKNIDKFDIITCMELLEHVPDISSLIGACRDMLKPGGDLFLATINRSVKSYMLAIIVAEYILNLLPTGTHDYSKFIKPSELNKCLKQHQFELVDLAGMAYIPAIKLCTITNNPAVNYIAHARYKG